MSRRTEQTVMAAVVGIGALAGVAIAGIPHLGSADPIAVEIGDVASPSGTVGGATPTSSLPLDTVEPLTTTRANATTTSSTSTSTTEPEVVIRPPDQVTVLVANGTTVTGAAARLSATIDGIGHPTLVPLSTSGFDSSEVWFADGYEPEALNLAAILGVFPDRVVPMPDNARFDPGDAHLVVIVGPELARAGT